MSEFSFDHINIGEIDPNQAEIAEGMYTFQVAKSEMKQYDVKDKDTGKSTGVKANRLAITLVVVDDEKYNGRRFFASFFENSASARQLRLISDATGVQQGEGATVEQWGQELVGARFKAPVLDNPKRIDTTTNKPTREPNYWKVVTA